MVSLGSICEASAVSRLLLDVIGGNGSEFVCSFEADSQHRRSFSLFSSAANNKTITSTKATNRHHRPHSCVGFFVFFPVLFKM